MRPVQQLIGAARVDLPAGERRTVRFTLHADLTSFTGRDLVRIVEPGAVELRVGASSADIRAVFALELVGSCRQVGPDRALEPAVGGLARLMHVDWPLEQLRGYHPAVAAPDDLVEFWDETARPGRGPDRGDVRAGGLRAGRRRDLRRHVRWSWRRSGAGLAAPARRRHCGRGALPAVVQYQGYNGGRGLAHEHVFWATAGYAHLVVDTRGQGSGWTSGATGDPVGSAPSQPGFLTRGIEDPRTYYYARVYTDAVRALEALRAHDLVDPSRVAVAGASQGGGIALATAALAPTRVAALLCDVPFLCDFRRAAAVAQTRALPGAGALPGRSPGSRSTRLRAPWRTSTARSWADRRRLLPCSRSR